MPSEVPPEVRAEFDAWLDEYAEAWGEHLRDQFGDTGKVAALATAPPVVNVQPIIQLPSPLVRYEIVRDAEGNMTEVIERKGE